MMGMMDIRKLQKKLLKEELKRRRQKSTFWRLIVPGSLIAAVLLVGGLLFYLSRLDQILEDDFAQAEVQLSRGEHQQALEQFQSIYQRHPTFKLAPEALYQSGEILDLYLKQYPEALLAYLSLEKEYPVQYDLVRQAQIRIADIYKNRQRDDERAVAEYRKLLEMGADDPDRVHYEIGDSYFRLERYAEAAETFEHLSSAYPQSPLLAEVRYRLGMIYSLLGNNTLAVQAYRDVIRTWPQSPYAVEAQFSLASVLEERDEFREALTLLEGLQGRYSNTEALNRKIELLKNRMKKKQRG